MHVGASERLELSGLAASGLKKKKGERDGTDEARIWAETWREQTTGHSTSAHRDEDVGVVQADGDIGELHVCQPSRSGSQAATLKRQQTTILRRNNKGKGP
jgi:hypothetical protein